MAALPPPEGMTEADYDAIHAAVVETVRGRWFLTEFARRNRVEEVQEMLAAIGRLETVVTSQRVLPPPPEATPHTRLLTQRADEIAGRLNDIIEELRESGADAYLCDDLEAQARAIAGLSRGPAPEAVPAAPPQPMIATEARSALEGPRDLPRERAEGPSQPSPLSVPLVPPMAAPVLPRAAPFQLSRRDDDLRVTALAALDRLSLAEKLALFS